MLDFPYIILFQIPHYFHYCAPVNFYYACNYSHFSNNYAPEIFHTCKFNHSKMKQILPKIHKHKVGMLNLVTVYAHQRVLMVVVLLPLLSWALQL